MGSTISRLRQKKGWTQVQLAEQLQMNPNHVSRWEKDRMRPRKKALDKLATLFEVPVEELLSSDQPPMRIAQEDPELAELLAQVAALNEEQRQALRTVLRSMLTCQQMEQLMLSKRGAA